MAEKVVFLDVDGVLVIAPTFRRMAPNLVAQLARILSETGAMVVVSSAWRTGGLGIRSRFGSELAACGENGALVRSRVIGRTKDLWSEDTAGNSIRGLEIKDWLERHPFFERFVILDDDGDMAPLTHRLVRTSPERGLTKEKADEAILMLNEEVVDKQTAEAFATLLGNAEAVLDHETDGEWFPLPGLILEADQ